MHAFDFMNWLLLTDCVSPFSEIMNYVIKLSVDKWFIP